MLPGQRLTAPDGVIDAVGDALNDSVDVPDVAVPQPVVTCTE